MVAFDLYLPNSPEPAPLVVVAHGFTRGKANMAGWGECLAREGFVAVVPTLPSWSDHRRNARSINELIDGFRDASPHAPRVRGERVGVMGFSAGGLSSLLAAADNPSIVVWIGLDPVDRDGLGAAAAARLKCHAVMLRAEPSPWNAHGNASAIEEAMQGRCQSVLVAGAVHVDAEWPTDWAAELMCGRSDEQKRAEFVLQAVAALKSNLRHSSASGLRLPAKDRHIPERQRGDAVFAVEKIVGAP